jgi:hypothetical protein
MSVYTYIDNEGPAEIELRKTGHLPEGKPIPKEERCYNLKFVKKKRPGKCPKKKPLPTFTKPNPAGRI